MLSRSILRLSAALCVWAVSVAAANAQGFYFTTDYAGYTGSWTRYASAADAYSNNNPLNSGAVPQLNLGVYVTSGAYPPGGGAPDQAIFTTNWYTSNTPVAGTGNTSNQSLGFFQLYNDPTAPGTVSSSYWNEKLNSLTVNQTGKGYVGAGDRFSPFSGLGFAETQGDYLSYAFTATASGLTGVPAGGGFEDNASKGSGFTGSFNAVFQNTGGNPALQGFYNISLQFNNQSTVNAPGFDFNVNATDQFASATVLPEPASCLTFAMVFAASAGFGWRKNRQRRANAQVCA